MRDPVFLGPLRIERCGASELIDVTQAALCGAREKVAIAFCNAHTADIAFQNFALARALRRFLVVNDGIGIEIGARIVSGQGFAENLNGTDFIPRLFGALQRPTRVFLLGAKPGVAEEAAAAFGARFANYVHAGARCGYFTPAQEHEVVAEIAAAEPDIVLVALGNPAQEIFIASHFDALPAKAMFGVGALLDFTAGRVPRAPQWVRACRAEWLYRLAQEPRRLAHRYVVGTSRFFLKALFYRLRPVQPNYRAQ